MTTAIIQALMSHWRVHWLQLATLLTGIALATGLWSAVQAINAEARASYARANAQLALGQFDELHDPSGLIPVTRYVDLRRSGWQVAAVLEGPYRIAGRTLRLMGVDMVAYPALPAMTEAEQSVAPPEPADMLTAPGRLLIAQELAPLFRDQSNLPPVSFTTALPPDVILTDIGVAETLLNQPGLISRLIVLPNQPRDRPPLTEIAPELERSGPSLASRYRTIDGQFSPEPVCLWSVILCRWPVHRERYCWAGLRPTPRHDPHIARAGCFHAAAGLFDPD